MSDVPAEVQDWIGPKRYEEQGEFGIAERQEKKFEAAMDDLWNEYPADDLPQDILRDSGDRC